jgi:hypothetical protein
VVKRGQREKDPPAICMAAAVGYSTTSVYTLLHATPRSFLVRDIYIYIYYIYKRRLPFALLSLVSRSLLLEFDFHGSLAFRIAPSFCGFARQDIAVMCWLLLVFLLSFLLLELSCCCQEDGFSLGPTRPSLPPVD